MTPKLVTGKIKRRDSINYLGYKIGLQKIRTNTQKRQIMNDGLQTLFCGFSRQGFSVALKPVLELDFVDQTGLKLTEICLPLPPKY